MMLDTGYWVQVPQYPVNCLFFRFTFETEYFDQPD